MKQLLVMLLLIPFLSLGQEKQPTHHEYVEILGKPRMLSNKVKMEIDYGQESILNADQRQVIDNKINDLTLMIDAMNFMSTLGWEFVQAYTAENGASMGSEMMFHWLLKKEFSIDSNESLPLIKENVH